MEEVKELLTFHSFVKSATKGASNKQPQQSFMEEDAYFGLMNSVL